MKGKDIIYRIFTIILCFLLCFVVACKPSGSDSSSDDAVKTYTVMLSESRYYTTEEYIKDVEAGGNVSFRLLFENGYTFGNINCEDYAVEVSLPDENGRRTVELIVYSVQQNKRLEVSVTEAEKVYSVTLRQSDVFRCENAQISVEAGQDAVFTLLFDGAYIPTDIDYHGNYSLLGANDPVGADGKRAVTLTLQNIQKDEVITVNHGIYVPPVSMQYTVQVVTEEVFTCENAEISVEKGQNAVFSLSFDSAYMPTATDYDGEYEFAGIHDPIAEGARRAVTLTLKNVRKNERITVAYDAYTSLDPDDTPPDDAFIAPAVDSDDNVTLTPVSGRAVIRYSLNGGELISDPTRKEYTMTYTLPTRPRPNASIGVDMIQREGYTLVCWNTKPDGSGTRVGLGSRAPVLHSEAISLYAQWAKWTDVNAFTYTLVDYADIVKIFENELTLAEAAAQSTDETPYALITEYTGANLAAMVVPEYIAGYPVGGIYTGAVENQTYLKTVVVAPKTEYVFDKAFTGCPKLTDVVLHDAMSGLTDHSFGEQEPVEKLHINMLLPLTVKNIDGGYFAHKMEMLIVDDTPAKNELVIWGTCATIYAVQSDYLEENLKGDWNVVNMGTVGEIGSLYQIDLIKQYLEFGDVFVHLLDIGLSYAFFADISFDLKAFQSVEDNYDLLESLNMRDYSRVLGSFSAYVQTKKKLLEKNVKFDIDYVLDYFSEDGDCINERGGNFDNMGKTYSILSREEMIELNVVETLPSVYDDLIDLGIDVYTDISPFNVEGVEESLMSDMQWMLEALFSNTAATLIGTVEDAAFDNDYIFDDNYHLSSIGARIYTERMCNNLPI